MNIEIPTLLLNQFWELLYKQYLINKPFFQRFYLIGSNNTQTRFRVLKIDRTDPKELILVDDKVEYNKQEIHQLLNMIGFGNRNGRNAGFNKLVSAFGIVGKY